MLTRGLLALLTFALPLCTATARAEAPLRAGIAVTDITPPKGYRMSGYFSERLNTGTRDPLLAKAVVFEQDGERAALVFCDLIGVSLTVSTEARNRIELQTGIPADHVAIAATHTHTGPLYSGALREHFHRKTVEQVGSDPHEATDYPAELVDKLVAVVADAHARLQAVRLAAGTAQEDRLSFNRRFHMTDGTVRFNPGQQNPDIVRVAGPIDPDVGLLSITPADAAADAAPEAAIVAFALHLDTLGGTEYSADYPKVLQDKLRESFGPGFMSLFGAGTCGDINHVDVRIKGRRTTEEIGTLLADTVADGLKTLTPVESPSLAVRAALVNAPRQTYTDAELAEATRNMDHLGTPTLSFLEQVAAYKTVALSQRPEPTLPIEVHVFRLSSEVAIVTLPGEVFVDLGLAIKDASPFATTLVIELTNDAPGYIPTQKAFVEGSYETVNSQIAPGGGERMVETAIGLLRELKAANMESVPAP
jgi:neutral ceramidase